MLRLKVGCKNSCSRNLRLCVCVCLSLSVVCNSWTFRNLHKFRNIPPCVGKLWIYRILHETLPFAWARLVCMCVCVSVGCARVRASVLVRGRVCVIASKGLHGAGMCIWIFYKPRCPIELYVCCMRCCIYAKGFPTVRVCVCVAHASVGQQVIVYVSLCVCVCVGRQQRQSNLTGS